MIPNMIGAYGEWAAQAMQDPARLSFRQPMFGNLEAWRAVARVCGATPADPFSRWVPYLGS